MGRYEGKTDSGHFGYWLGLWVTWLVFFIILLPQVMCNGDFGCSNVTTDNLLYLWYFVLTLGGGTVPYLDVVFGCWAFLLVIGCLEMMN